jgi:hypothetical protein
LEAERARSRRRDNASGCHRTAYGSRGARPGWRTPDGCITSKDCTIVRTRSFVGIGPEFGRQASGGGVRGAPARGLDAWTVKVASGAGAIRTAGPGYGHRACSYGLLHCAGWYTWGEGCPLTSTRARDAGRPEEGPLLPSVMSWQPQVVMCVRSGDATRDPRRGRARPRAFGRPHGRGRTRRPAANSGPHDTPTPKDAIGIGAHPAAT